MAASSGPGLVAVVLKASGLVLNSEAVEAGTCRRLEEDLVLKLEVVLNRVLNSGKGEEPHSPAVDPVLKSVAVVLKLPAAHQTQCVLKSVAVVLKLPAAHQTQCVLKSVAVVLKFPAAHQTQCVLK